MTVLYLTQGLPGSGKTTWALAQMSGASGLIGRANRDEIRRSFFPDISSEQGYRYSKKSERIVTAIQREAVGRFLAEGMSVIVDDTNIPVARLGPFQDIANFHDADIVVVRFKIAVDEAKDRQQFRPPKEFVPHHVIDNMASAWDRETPEWDLLVKVEDGYRFEIEWEEQ